MIIMDNITPKPSSAVLPPSVAVKETEKSEASSKEQPAPLATNRHEDYPDTPLVHRKAEKPFEVSYHKSVQSLKKWPEHSLLRLMVDGVLLKKENGWEAYERREPGCIKKMASAWAFGLELLNKNAGQLSIDKSLLTNLHRVICPDIHDAYPGEMSSDQADQSKSINFFGLLMGYGETYHTDKGLEEAYAHRAKHCEILEIETLLPFAISLGDSRIKPDFMFVDDDVINSLLDEEFACRLLEDDVVKEKPNAFYWAEVISTNAWILSEANKLPPGLDKKFKDGISKSGDIPLSWVCLSSRYHPLLVEQLLPAFDSAVKQAKTEQQVLEAIVEFIPQFEQIHPFNDANGRLFHLLTNLILVSKGMMPLPLESPSELTFYDRESLIKVIRKAMDDANNQATITSDPVITPFDSELHQHLEPLTEWLGRMPE